jgi:putative flippase GtrA
MRDLPCYVANFKEFAERHRTKIHFVLIGGINTVFGLAAYPLLYFWLAPHKLHYLQVLAISQAICITFAFVTNKYVVFRTVGNHFKEYIKFLSFHLIYFAINLAALPFMVEFLSMNPVWAQSFFAVAVIVSSYFWHSRITFQANKNHNGPV